MQPSTSLPFPRSRASVPLRMRRLLRTRWTVVTAAGIPVRVHVSFLIIVVLVVLASLEGGWPLVLFSLGFLGAAYTCVVLHELGHCLVARRLGVGTREIVVLPIGGVALLERDARRPADELVIALAGPAVNIAILAVLVPAVTLLGGWGNDFLLGLVLFNGVMVLFNMIPAFPMDGGRVLRALLTGRMGAYGATRLAARLGRVLAVLMAAAGLVFFHHSPVLLLIGVFVWFAAGAEAKRVPPPRRIFPRPDPLFDRPLYRA